jgi:K+-transporting ATPase KdpF subunit
MLLELSIFAFIVIGLLGYLTYTLIRPEQF